jgi:hypothetical protein
MPSIGLRLTERVKNVSGSVKKEAGVVRTKVLKRIAPSLVKSKIVPAGIPLHLSNIEVIS